MLFRSSPIFLVIFRVWDPFETTPVCIFELFCSPEIISGELCLRRK